MSKTKKLQSWLVKKRKNVVPKDSVVLKKVGGLHNLKKMIKKNKGEKHHSIKDEI